MELQTLTYDDKVTMNENADIPAVNKGRAADWNEVKTVVNNNANAIADHVTEIGETSTSGVVWKWSKWKSGKVELTGFKAYSGMNISQSSAGTFYGGSGTTQIPFELASIDYIGAEETSPRSSGVISYTSTISGTTLTTEFRAFASGTNLSCGIRYHIIGTLANE